MRKPNFSKAVLWVTAISPLLFTACVDDSYDLAGDIDMTVTVGGNLSIPGSGTEEFTLDDIMDLEYHENPEDSIIRVDANGDYRLLKQESSDPTDVTIDPVTINEPQCNPTRTTLDFESPVGIDDYFEAKVEDVRMNFTFTKDDVTTDITSISSAEVDCSAALTLSFDETSYNVNEITLKQEFSIELTMIGQTDANNMAIVLDDTENYQFREGEPQTIEFIHDQTIRQGETLRIPIRFTRIENFPDGQGLYEVGRFKMEVEVIANGTATTPKVNEGTSQVVLINDAEVRNIVLNQVTGKFDPNVDITVDPVTINDVPDFLNEDGNNLDLKNPYIKLAISNETPLDVNLTADIIRMKSGSQDVAPITIGSNTADNKRILLYAGAEGAPTVSTYYLSREAMPEVVNTATHTYNIVMGDDMYNLIRTIPDEIRLENIVAKALDNEYTISLGADGAQYVVNTEYEVNAPLTFGDELLIVYEDTINDWNSDLEDISFKKAIVEMDALNGIPLNFNVNATAIDVNGNPYPNVTVTPVQGNIKPGLKVQGNSSAQATDSKVVLEIACQDGVMDNLDGLIISFTADTQGVTPEQQNATLNKGMTLQLNNIRITVEGGVTVDLN